MTTISIADKNRLTVRGVMDGARYLVKQEGNGWWIEPAPEARRRTREVKDAKKDLADHLDALVAHGFTFESAQTESVPPCRF
ncbi:MAG: hypothetical protein WCT12_31130 [Verrucomicrobiota bacterium]